MTTGPSLARRLGTTDAVVIGLGAMLGAGIFAAPAPAARAAGSAVLLGLGIAALVAFANATSTAQLAAVHPESGGAYVYGRERLGPWWGFAAGWSFVVGKSASCAAMALTVGTYLAPAPWERPVAAAAVVAVAAVDHVGVHRTARASRVVVVVVLLVLALVVVAAATAGGADPAAAPAPVPSSWYGVLQSAGLLFFAFAGYARIATLGEEVRDPRRTIPRAVVLAFAVALAVYAAVLLAALHALGAGGVAGSDAPLADAATAGGWAWAGPVVRAAAALAALGALLGLVAGVGRTTLAMARRGDLPGWLGAVHPRYRVPHRAGAVLAAVVVVAVLLADVRTAIGWSSTGVLTYYLIANLAARRQPRAERRFPRWLTLVGAAGCVLLVVTLPPASVLGGLGVLAAGLAGRWVVLRRAARARRTGRPGRG